MLSEYLELDEEQALTLLVRAGWGVYCNFGERGETVYLAHRLGRSVRASTPQELAEKLLAGAHREVSFNGR